MTDFQPGAPTSAAGPDGRPLSPSPPARPQPPTTNELEQVYAEWLATQRQIGEAIAADDFNQCVRLSKRCRELDRIIFAQPLSFIQRGAR